VIAHDAELRSQLAALEKEKQALLQGSSMIYGERCAVFESVKAEAIAQAVLKRQAQLRSIESLFEYQQYVATTACEVRILRDESERSWPCCLNCGRVSTMHRLSYSQ
jgi:hypothetical protein